MLKPLCTSLSVWISALDTSLVSSTFSLFTLLQPPPGTAPCTGEVGGLMPMLEVLVLHLLYLLPPRLPGK